MEGDDYQAASGALTFDPGETSKPVTITINGDTTDEFDETFFVNLSGATNARIADARGVATIVDDDAAPSFSIEDEVFDPEGDDGSGELTFTVRLSAASEKPISVNYATADDTAEADGDYLATSGTLDFAAGDTSKTVTVTVNGDLEFEPDETFFVNLSGEINATIGDGQAVGTIRNDDPLLTVNSTLDKPDLNPGNFVVDTDTPGQITDITLRAAIMEANALPGPDAITLPAGTYRLAVVGTGEDGAAKGDLDITDTTGKLTIYGAGADVTIIDADELDRVFHVLPGVEFDLIGVTVRKGLVTGATAMGGGVRNLGVLSITDSVLTENTAGPAAGAIDNRGVLYLSASTLSGNSADEGGAIHNPAGAELSIWDSVLEDNTANVNGGAIVGDGTMNISGTTFSRNTAPLGGAVYTSGDLTITDSSFLHNAASGNGDGGAIYKNADAGRTLTITGSTFAHNASEGYGGALYLKGDGDVYVTNSTFADNASGGSGGAAHVDRGPLTLSNVTIAGNSAQALGGGVFNAATVHAKNTIFAQNTAVQADPDVSGAFDSDGHNLLGDAGGSTGWTGTDLVGSAVSPVDAMLRPLDDNGGPTLTMALNPGSPAMDAGDNQGAPAVDQRGLPRPADGDDNGSAIVDIGAYESRHNRPPNIQDQTFDVDENVAPLTLVGVVQADDPDAGDLLTFAIIGGNEGDAFAIDADTGELTVVGSLDHETIDSYSLTIQVEDTAWLTSSATITVQVNDLNERPYVVGSGIDDRTRADGTAPETIGLANVFADVDDGDTLSFAAASSNEQLVTVRIDGGSELEFTYHAYTADQDRTPAVVTVTATDSGSLAVEDSFTVTVDPAKTFEYELVVVAQATPQVEVTTLPTSLSSVPIAGTFYVEVWVRDLLVAGSLGSQPGTASEGVEQASIDVTYDPNLSTGLNLDWNGIFNRITSYRGDIDQTNGVVENFAGATLIPTQGVSPKYGRLGIIEFEASEQGQQSFGLQLDGDLEGTRRDADGSTGGLIDPSQIRLADSVNVTVVPEGGTIPFQPAIHVNVGSDPTALASTDVDNDGDPDFVAASGSNDSVSILLNTPGLGHTLLLTTGDVATEVNFGNRPLPGEIRGQVFNDVNQNHVRDLLERGLKDFVVYLDLNDNGQMDQDEPERTTDENGDYAFTNVPTMATYVVAQAPKAGATSTYPQADGKWTIDLAPGQIVDDADFGNALEGGVFGNSIKGIYFLDANGNGQQDAGEEGLPGRTVYVDLDDNGEFDANEPFVQTLHDVGGTPADEAGSYEFPLLGPGTYKLRVNAPDNLRQTFPLGNDLVATEFLAGDGPRSIAVDDFNDDRYLDLAVANGITNDVSVLFNDGQNSFSSPVNLPVGFGASSVASGDFDDDGFADLVVANAYSGSVSVLLNQQGGTFAGVQSFWVGIGPSGVATGDFDGDGDIDLAVSNDGSNNVSVLRNNGSGVFDVRNNYAADDSPGAVVAGDLDGDGDIDLAAANIDSDNVTLLINPGDGTFVPAVNLPVGDAPFALAAADLDGNGTLDLAVVNVLSDDVSILLNQGLGLFEPAVNFAAGSGPLSVAATDLDTDGDVDLVVTSGHSSDLSILRNDGTGRFSDPASFGVAKFVALQPFAIAAADLDGSGSTDLAVANGDTNNVSVLMNTLVAGAHTVVLTGDVSVAGVNFGASEINQQPTLDAIADPNPIDEDSPEQTIALSGISDGGDGGQTLTVTAESSDPGLIPHPTVDYTSPQTTASLRYTPMPNQSGTAVITVTVTDDGGTENGGINSITRSFTVTVAPVDETPSVSDITNRETNEDTSTGAITFTVDDRETPPAALTLDGRSSDRSLVPDGNIVFGGSGTDRTVTITPVENRFGTTTITITVEDADGNASTDTFELTVHSVNDAPSAITLDSSTVAENEAGVGIGNLEVTDVDSGDTHSFSVSDARFEVAGGQLKLRDGESLDHESEPTVSLQVTATDSGTPPRDVIETFTITVNDVNEFDPVASDARGPDMVSPFRGKNGDLLSSLASN